ncbi:MAG TPA: DUF2510 domain-containing protein [Galbitalea sp.]|jgi:hypothetical protein
MTEPVSPGAPPAGWYPDPPGSGRLRWWDGTQWTDQFAPVAVRGQVLRAPEGTDPSTPWIWVFAFLPLLSLLELPFLLAFYARVFSAVESDPSGVAAAEFAPDSGYFAIQGISLLLAAIFIVLAVFDYRTLRARGVPSPFHWGWTFLGGIVYIIGRSVVVRRRTGSGMAPLWVNIAVQVGAIVAIAIVTVASITPLINQIADISSS